jgi:hypothetical protein
MVSLRIGSAILRAHEVGTAAGFAILGAMCLFLFGSQAVPLPLPSGEAILYRLGAVLVMLPLCVGLLEPFVAVESEAGRRGYLARAGRCVLVAGLIVPLAVVGGSSTMSVRLLLTEQVVLLALALLCIPHGQNIWWAPLIFGQFFFMYRGWGVIRPLPSPEALALILAIAMAWYITVPRARLSH